MLRRMEMKKRTKKRKRKSNCRTKYPVFGMVHGTWHFHTPCMVMISEITNVYPKYKAYIMIESEILLGIYPRETRKDICKILTIAMLIEIVIIILKYIKQLKYSAVEK